MFNENILALMLLSVLRLIVYTLKFICWTIIHLQLKNDETKVDDSEKSSGELNLLGSQRLFNKQKTCKLLTFGIVAHITDIKILRESESCSLEWNDKEREIR